MSEGSRFKRFCSMMYKAGFKYFPYVLLEWELCVQGKFDLASEEAQGFFAIVSVN